MKGFDSGWEHPRVRLTPEDVSEMRELYLTGDWTMEELAEEFDVSLDTVRRALHGRKFYGEVQEPPPIPVLDHKEYTSATKNKVRAVRILVAHNWTDRMIASVTELSEKQVSRIRRGEVHSDIPDQFLPPDYRDRHRGG